MSQIILLGVWFLGTCIPLHFAFSEIDTTPSHQLSSSYPPVDLQDIGYDGSWEKFCDPQEIQKDFSPYHPDHELRVMRIVLCNMMRANNITRESLPAFAGYKYAEMVRFQAEDILERLLDKLSLDDADKRHKLLTGSTKINSPICFDRAAKAFKEKCIHEENAYFRMFRPILARACMVHWLKTDEIISHIEKVCEGKYMSGKGVNWQIMINSIKYKD